MTFDSMEKTLAKATPYATINNRAKPTRMQKSPKNKPVDDKNVRKELGRHTSVWGKEIKMYNNFPANPTWQGKELWDFEVRQNIITGNRLREHYFRNQMDLEKTKEAEKLRSDIQREREYQQTYLFKGSDGQLILIGEKFLGEMEKALPVKQFDALRLWHEESQDESILFISFLFGSAGNEKEVRLYLDEKRSGDQRYLNRMFASKGIGFQMKKTAEETIRKQLIEMAQKEAKDVMVSEIPGWYRTGNGWDYCFPGGWCWKEVTRWTL